MKKKDFALVLVFFAVLSTKCLLLYNDEERKRGLHVSLYI